MKIFISWSGERSRSVAASLKEMLPLVLHYADPWMSDVDIESGSRGLDKIAVELSGRNFGIICITRENLSAPWINFEAGALSKSLDEGRVVPLLLELDAKDIPPPLGQFQAKKIDKEGVRRLIQDINRSHSEQIESTRIDRLFESLWNDFEAKFSVIAETSAEKVEQRKYNDILEELVVGVRSVEAKLREFPSDVFPETKPPSIENKLFNFKLLREFAASLEKHGKDTNYPRLLVASGMIRNDFPWLADTIQESYECLNSTQPEVKRRGENLLRAVADFFSKPENTMDMMTNCSKDLKRMLHEVVEIIDHCDTMVSILG